MKKEKLSYLASMKIAKVYLRKGGAITTTAIAQIMLIYQQEVHLKSQYQFWYNLIKQRILLYQHQ